MRHSFTFFCTRIYVLTLLLSSVVCAAAPDEPSYFIFEGNPVAAKYVVGRLERLPVQDAEDSGGLNALEAVSALLRAPRLNILSTSSRPSVAKISPPRKPQYGLAMFEVSVEGAAAQKSRLPALAWSGPTPFRETVLGLPGAHANLKRSLVTQSRRALAPELDYRTNERVGRRLRGRRSRERAGLRPCRCRTSSCIH